jgi:type IV pilus assembly protein PilV
MSLVEALVALVVLSIGMLGIAGLYVESMRANRTALVRTQAISLANDMADRIRANPRGRDDYEGAGALNNCVAGVDCSAEELAQDDVARWRTAIATALPAGASGDIQFTQAAAVGRPDQYAIDVTWSEPGSGGPEAYSYRANLQMIPVLP